ncbi:paraneoplastic antigen Ma1 homolog [Brienomyrus brachyistius]|uniref:paraneoplastic antigen Ma1 homolog n=1 Tax=Brienomyrus brachyistius TaxID=42636 RepID=UPI0020B2FC15|nr:paraneoplastic antigen Ma1 homolog [Brienomyrus brachyistius]
MTEGKTVADLRSYCAASSSKRDSEESLFEVMGELLKQVYKGQSEGQGYRRLRVFSGITPTPAGEEPLEYWLEQATLMVEESDCPDREKRRRILESLRGPALEIIRVLRFSKPEAKPEEYLEAINSAFGSPESGEDLYFAFRLMQQKSGEKLSDYLRRLEPFLAKVVKKGGILVRDMDRVRVEQLLRGAVGADLLLLQLRLKERRNNPPAFIDLLTEIREEEEYEKSRQRVSVRVRNVGAQEDSVVSGFEMQELKADLKALKAKVIAMSSNPNATRDAVETQILPLEPLSVDKDRSDVVALQKRVSRLKQKVRTLEEDGGRSVLASAVKPISTEGSSPSSYKTHGMREADRFCYRCGGN